MGIAIHGFGRIGRTALRTALFRDIFTPVVISDIKDPNTLAALFEVDTNYGRFPDAVRFDDSRQMICAGERKIKFVDSKNKLPNWASLQVDVVIDCTGRAVRREVAEEHLKNGAKKVLVSAPSKTAQDCDVFLLRGINDDTYHPAKHHIVSMASCTTNALAPVVSILREKYGIKSGFFTTTHSYTNTQALIDQPMPDRRDSWEAPSNIVPSSSGAAKSLGFIWPDLAGKITGKAYRVPVSTGSIVEFNVILGIGNTTADDIKNVFRAQVRSKKWKNILDVLEDEYASCRIVGDTHSCIVDLPLLQMLDRNFLSIAAWYDNEMGYATRLAETAASLEQKIIHLT